MSTPARTDTALDVRPPTFSGMVLLPQDAGYDEARAIHNGLIDKRPGVIARCRTAEVIAAAVQFAAERGLEIAVRGGGHKVAGRCVTDGGVMIDPSLMGGVTVDATQRTASGRYVNYLGDDEGSSVASPYGANYDRRRRVKAQYDPSNLFRLNQNIVPA